MSESELKFSIMGFGFANHSLTATQKKTIGRIADRLVSGDDEVPRLSATQMIEIIGHAIGTRNLEMHANRRADSVLTELKKSLTHLGATNAQISKVKRGHPVTKEVSSSSQSLASDRKVVIAVHRRAAPPRMTCRTFSPTRQDTIVVDQREFAAPRGVTVTNWASADVAHKDREGTRARPACRDVDNVTEIIVHETVSSRINPLGTGRPNVQLVLHRDGTFTQHADLVHDLNHAAPHNSRSFGFEAVNPVLPRMAGAPDNRLPSNLADFPCIQNTRWTGQDRPLLKDGSFGPPRNRNRHYVRPTDAQLESATRLIEWATDATVGHGMNIPLDWQGLRSGNLLLFGRDDALFADSEPGIYAHGYFRHSDGWFIILYAWLRLDQNFNVRDAVNTAIDIAQNHIVRHQEPRGRRALHADLRHI